MDKLPIDIIREEILPYTYQPQPKELCNDIRSFYNIRDYLYKLYYDRWLHTFQFEENADLNWLDNDICRFFNDDRATMFGYTDNCLNKYKRNFNLKDKTGKEVRDYINKIISCKNVKYSINVQVGILKCEERLKLVDFAHSLEFELVD